MWANLSAAIGAKAEKPRTLSVSGTPMAIAGINKAKASRLCLPCSRQDVRRSCRQRLIVRCLSIPSGRWLGDGMR